MKALRIFGIVVGVILALLAISIGVLYAMFDGEKIKTEISRVVLEQKQRKLVISGTPTLSVWPDVGLYLQKVTLSERGSDTQFMSLDAARVSVAVMPLLSRQVQVRALEVDGLNATVIKNKDGSLNIADLLGQDAAKQADKSADAQAKPTEPLHIDVKAIRIANARLTWRDDQAGTRTEVSNLSLNTGAIEADSGKQTASVKDLLLTVAGKSGADSFDLKLDAPKLQLSPTQSSSDKLTLTASTKGAARNATVNLTLSGVQGNTEKLNIANLALQLDAKAGDSTVKGQLNSPVSVNVTGQSVALNKLAGSLEVAHPAMPMKQVTLPIQGSLQYNAKAQSAALDLATQFDESKIALGVKAAKFSPLSVAFDLDIDQLNIDKYLPPKAPATSSKEVAVDTPIDLSALKGPAASGAVRIGALQVSNIKLQKINAKVNLAGGKLDLAPISFNLYKGSATGSLSANADGNAIAFKQALTGVSINPLLKDVLNKDLLEGQGSVALDITTRGASVNALKKALGGSASVSLKDGAIKGINLAQTLRDAKAKLGKADATQAANAGQKTDFSELRNL